MSQNEFSIIIPTYNRADLLRNALHSVQRLSAPQNWRVEVIVVDNNSTDNTGDVIATANSNGPFPVRRVVERKQGLNNARNCGLTMARFEHLIFLDDDMVVDSGWLEGYVAAQEQFSPDCVVGPVEPWFEEPPHTWLTSAMIRSVDSSYSRKGSESFLLSNEQGHEVPGCNFGFRRQAGKEVGGFHPGLDRSGQGMLAGGDSEFGEKLVLNGKRIAYSPICKVRHFISKNKISRKGLRDRWEGTGATSRALMQLRGEKLPTARQIRLFFRMNRFLIRSWRNKLVGKPNDAFIWELEALKLRGYLFKGPSNMEPRQWPPQSLDKID